MANNDQIRDAAKREAEKAPPPSPEQESAIGSALSGHVTKDTDTAAGDTAA